MSTITIDDAINACESVVHEMQGNIKHSSKDASRIFKKCADEHKQVAEWLKELKELREQTRWIPVSERLPEIQQVVLLSLRSLDVEVGFRAKTEPYFYCHNAGSCYIELQNVLAWMPLPQPYKESEDKE